MLKKVNGIPHKLLIVGAELPGTSPFRQVITSEGLSEQVVVVGYADHQDMVLVYNAADLFIYPSSYEGFGMPVLEAMACGAPVVALNNTSLPEIAGGIAHLLKNAEVATLKEGIEAVLGDPAWRERMSKAGPKRAASRRLALGHQTLSGIDDSPDSIAKRWIVLHDNRGLLGRTIIYIL